MAESIGYHVSSLLIFALLRSVVGQIIKATQAASPLPTGIHNVTSNYNIPDEYVALLYTPPAPTVSGKHQSTCFNYARSIHEPYSDIYLPRKNFSLTYPWTEVRRAYWSWRGTITSTFFQIARSSACAPASGLEILHYKVVDGRLYKPIDCNPCTEVTSSCTAKTQIAEELLKVTLYLFPIPDMEILLDVGDECRPETPVLNQHVCRPYEQAGFTMPSLASWVKSMGPVQMSAYNACLLHRYPASQRKPRVIWRGSGGASRKARAEAQAQLHLLGKGHPDLLDIKAAPRSGDSSDWSPVVDNSTLHRGPADPMESEDVNHYCGVVDLDGSAWPDSLVHFPTAVLRAATNRTAFFDQYFAPGVTFVQFSPDLEDFVDKARQVVAECTANDTQSVVQAQVANRLQLSRTYLDQVGLAEVMAYSLLSYKSVSELPLDTSLEGYTAIDGLCCTYTHLPIEFQAEVNAYLAGPDFVQR